MFFIVHAWASRGDGVGGGGGATRLKLCVDVSFYIANLHVCKFQCQSSLELKTFRRVTKLPKDLLHNLICANIDRFTHFPSCLPYLHRRVNFGTSELINNACVGNITNNTEDSQLDETKENKRRAKLFLKKTFFN